jgi:colicin import membrane protein
MTDVADMPLVAIPVGLTPLDVFAAKDTKAIDGILARVRKEIDAFKGDMTTAAGRAEIKSMAMKVVKSKTYLESIGAALAKEQKEIPKRIDATRRHIAETLDAWRDEVRRPVTEWEAEQDRIRDFHLDQIEGIKTLAKVVDSHGRPHSAAVLRASLDALEAYDVDKQPVEYRQEYFTVLQMAKPIVQTALEERIKYEADQAELSRLRKIQEDREREEREERLRKEGEERARLEAEADARAQAEKVKRDAEAAELRAKLEIEAAERRAAEAEANARAKVEAEQRAFAAEAAKREADIEHKRKINAAAVKALVDAGIAEDIAKGVLKLIIAGAVPAVKITY